MTGDFSRRTQLLGVTNGEDVMLKKELHNLRSPADISTVLKLRETRRAGHTHAGRR